MASIQGGLPDGLRAIYERFGQNVEFQLFDRRGGMDNMVEWEGWEHLSQLESEGNYEHLKHRLRTALDGHEAVGGFGPDAIAQARGLAPLIRNAGLHPADGREFTHARSGGPEGPSEGAGVAADSDEAKAIGAQARGIEAEQARLRDESIGERYQTALQTYLQANTQCIERIENRLETLIENQQVALGDLNAQRPGFFTSSAIKAKWLAGAEAAQDRLQVLRGRLSHLQEVKEQSEELAEVEMRSTEPELAKDWDDARRSQRNAEELRRQERQTDRRQENSRDPGRGRELDI